MAWNFFQKSKERLHNPEIKGASELETKINTELKNAEDDKNAAIREIEKIKEWAAEAIIETYADVFPNGNLTYYREKYKEDALEKYEQIKADNAEKIGAEKAEKCDKIVKAYMTQIKLRESKLVLYDKLSAKYREIKEKLQKTKIQQEEKSKLSKHEARLKQLDGENADTDYFNAVSDTAKLEELESEFEHKVEYTKQLNILQEKYKEEGNVEDYNMSLAFKDEIDKMINDLE